jgi:alcohol dehydrogenase
LKALVLRQHGEIDTLRVVLDYPQPKAAAGPRGDSRARRVLQPPRRLHRKGHAGHQGARCRWSSASTWRAKWPRTAAPQWKPGARVLVNPLNKERGLMGEALDGGMAEYCLVSADQLVPMPDNVSFVDAAALPVPTAPAHRMLVTHRTLAKGERVLVLGASGGVGMACVVLAKRIGCEVIACASSDDKLARLRELGADHAVNYKQTDFSKWVIEKFGKPQRRSYEGGVDCVVNFTGGDTWVPSLRCVKRGGRILVCGATAGFDPKEDLRYIWSFELRVIGSNSYTDEDLRALLELVSQGRGEARDRPRAARSSARPRGCA